LCVGVLPLRQSTGRGQAAQWAVGAWTVDGVQKAAKTSFPTDDVYGNVPYPALRLVTCGGPFDANTGEYLDSIVVYAHLTGIAAK
jgi:hypothetical protein